MGVSRAGAQVVRQLAGVDLATGEYPALGLLPDHEHVGAAADESGDEQSATSGLGERHRASFPEFEFVR
jgi:hypothetical protein